MSRLAAVTRVAPRWPAYLAAAVTTWIINALAAAPAAACSVCYGSRDIGSPLVSGARLGIFFLLAVTVVVLGGLTRFFLYLRARARLAESDGVAGEWPDFQRSVSP